ncbi:hypothetical protein [Marinilactibacillus sp. Marseille-P9653]|uniref:hypothetical protein n=1 Tax=Marinilactibacillus sp. Marseille-P9653 TaxID=2866583 RepID=UPI001CE3E8E1|nr:hypothetical protein [Marinilactibacillus sp. Marseille-P9653]
MTNIIAVLAPNVVLLIVFGVIIMLQVLFSKTESKFPGLILPIVSLMMSFLITLGIAAWVNPESSNDYADTMDSVIVESTDPEETDEADEVGVSVFGNSMENKNQEEIGSPILLIVLIFIFSNIPTIVLSIVYVSIRKRMNKEKHVNRTRIQDL